MVMKIASWIKSTRICCALKKNVSKLSVNLMKIVHRSTSNAFADVVLGKAVRNAMEMKFALKAIVTWIRVTLIETVQAQKSVLTPFVKHRVQIIWIVIEME